MKLYKQMVLGVGQSRIEALMGETAYGELGAAKQSKVRKHIKDN